MGNHPDEPPKSPYLSKLSFQLSLIVIASVITLVLAMVEPIASEPMVGTTSGGNGKYSINQYANNFHIINLSCV